MKRISLWLTDFNKAKMKVWYAFLLRNTETWRRAIELSSTIFSHYKYNITQSFENKFTNLLEVFRYYVILSYPCFSYLKAVCWKPPSNVQFQYIIHKMLRVSPDPPVTKVVNWNYQSLGYFYKPRDTFQEISVKLTDRCHGTVALT